MSNRRENSEGVESISEPMGFQHGSRRFQLAPLRKRQSAQQMVTADGDVALGEPLQKNLRSVGFLIENRSCGRKQQDVAIARLCAHRLFSLRQKLRLSIRISEGGEKDSVPSEGLLRRIAKRQSRLRRGRMGHAISRDLAFEQSRQTPTNVDDSVNKITGLRSAIKRARATRRHPPVDGAEGKLCAIMHHTSRFCFAGLASARR